MKFKRVKAFIAWPPRPTGKLLVDGYAFYFHLQPWMRMFASISPESGMWGCTEWGSGSIVNGRRHKTRKAAVSAAMGLCAKLGPEKTFRRVSEFEPTLRMP